ncbi:MAG: HD domain-containing phosphohydrolase [Pusillimonas sp.]
MSSRARPESSSFITSLWSRQPPTTPPKRGISVQLFIALTIICGTLLLGGVLAWKNYHSLQKIMLSAAGESAQQLARTLNERARRLIEPPENVIHLLAYDPITQATTLAQRLYRLPLLAESLNANEMLSAIYVGYTNGEFLLLRELSSQPLKESFSAPPDSEFLVQSISLGPDLTMAGEWRFYSRELGLLRTDPKPDYRFDPRSRPWFAQAISQAETAVIKPYVFFTTGQTGITLAQRDATGQAVIGMDVEIDDLNSAVVDLRMTDNSELAVLDAQGTVIAYPDTQRIRLSDKDGVLNLPKITETGVASLAAVFQHPPPDTMPRLYRVNGEEWYGMRAPLLSFSHYGSHLLIAVPAAEMLVDAQRALIEEITWVAALTILLLLLGWILSQRISRPLQLLTDQVRSRADFDFSGNIGAPSYITEIRELGQVLDGMSRTINNFQAISLALNHETQLDRMLGDVLEKLIGAFGVDSGAIYLLDSDTNTLQLAAHHHSNAYPAALHLDADSAEALPATVARALDSSAQFLCVGLDDRNQEQLGVLVLQLNAAHPHAGEVQRTFRRFVQELSGAAAVAIETRQLIEAQQRLLDAIIKLLANAIDAKSPYTGGHCERVPELAELLLNEAISATDGPYADFDMNSAERYEFRIAAWLHDCGKITTPESIMDKATKLETQYNRIHEIRTRFEVLRRDADIDYWQGLAQGGDPHALRQQLERQYAILQDEFAFVANANIGGESMDDADIDRLRQIGARRWWRHFDNRLGLDKQEMSRLGNATRTLPAQEELLTDRSDHLVPWTARKPPVDKNDPRNVWGFDMHIPAHAHNYGELHNLSTRRGTLTAEERFKINEHIVQTIMMLSSLPFPEHLKRVPAIAGNHHEKMDGTGYPRRLDADDLSIPERVMMIADIFEALTAADRPYKTPKTLSESIKIMTAMARTGHIDPDLLRLFLNSGVYMTYSKRFLYSEQIDEVDVRRHLEMLDA